MKKAIVMAGVLFALTMTAGCGSQNQDHAATAESQTQDTASGSGTAAQSENTDQKQTDGDRTDTAEADVTEEALQDNENTEKSSKVLVAYYSATGNTKAAAETIADAAGGELFELQPTEAYTTEDLDYNDPESRVCKEHEDPDLQDVKLEEVTPESFSNADVVFLGYPIWPVNEFVKENDFTGKTVIPFCTSASSSLGDSGENLAEMAGTGEWLEGKRFSSGAAEEEIRNWVESLDLSAK